MVALVACVRCGLGEVGWHVGRRVSGDSGKCEGARRESEGRNVGCGSANPRDPSSERVGNSGGPGRVVGRGKSPEKAKASAPRGKHARTSSVFCNAVPQLPPPAAPEPRILISSRRTPPVMHLRFAPSSQCPTPLLPLPRLVILPTIMAILTQAPPLPS